MHVIFIVSIRVLTSNNTFLGLQRKNFGNGQNQWRFLMSNLDPFFEVTFPSFLDLFPGRKSNDNVYVTDFRSAISLSKLKRVPSTQFESRYRFDSGLIFLSFGTQL